MYKVLLNPFTNEAGGMILRLSDNTFIPFDPANTDYAEYLAWLDAGNTPLPSDSVDELTTNQGA